MIQCITMTSFHILDAFAQDIRVDAETETTREVSFVPEDGAESDGSYAPRRRGGGGSAAAIALSRFEMVIHLFGATADGTTVRTQVTGFEPFFFVRLPDTKRATRTAFETAFQARVVGSALEGAVTTQYELAGELIRFTNKLTFPFVRLSVKSIRAFHELAKVFLNKEKEPYFKLSAGSAPLEVFEANLDPMLRFFHLRDIQPCGWVSIPYEVEDCTEVTWDEVSPTTSSVPVAPFLCAFWDIECYSRSGAFPIPTRD
jgi:DNA polymerase delta subunit 1